MLYEKINIAIQSAMTLFNAQLINNDIGIVFDRSDPSFVYGNANHLRQVILNMLSNAIDAIKEKQSASSAGYRGEILVSIDEKDGESVCISVKDNGIGLSEEVQKHLFEPYYTTKGEGKGTGVGLYMSQTILQNYFGGHLELIAMEEGTQAKITIMREQKIETVSEEKKND